MANPVVAHTFDFGHAYLSTRTGGAPGSGTWSVADILFDGTGLEATGFRYLSTFGAGALDLTENRGVYGDYAIGSGAAANAFIGDGVPASPLPVTVTGFGASPKDAGIAANAWGVTHGAFSFGSAFFAVTYDPIGGTGPIRVIKSASGTSPWAVQDPSGLGPPSPADVSATAVQRIDNYIFVFTETTFSDATFQIFPFNMATGLWETPSTVLNIASFSSMGSNGWTNCLIKFLNGNFAVFYNAAGGSYFNLLTGGLGGTWGAAQLVPGSGMQQCVIDPALTLVHVITDDGSNGLDYFTVDQDGVIANTITTAIPAPVGSTDGVGHSSIQNGMLFIPRDDQVDFDNAVWVAALPVVSFSKELLPVPPGETDEIQGSPTVNAGGAGYALNDTGFVNGGIYSAWYKITGVAAGAVTDFQYTLAGKAAAGGGYSVVTNVGATPGGPQPGVGTGFTVDIDAVGPKVPSCAYMMFPNGYLLTPATIGITCPVGPLTATVGVPFTSDAPVVTGDTPPDTFVLLSGPGWMSIDAATGVVSGIPDVSGLITYTIQVTDNLGNVATTSPGCEIVVSATPPTIGITCPTGSGTGTVGTLFTSSAPAVTGDTPPDTFVLLSGPAWLSINATTGVVSGVPTNNGTFTYVIQVTDNLGNVATTAPGCSVTIGCPPTFFPGKGGTGHAASAGDHTGTVILPKFQPGKGGNRFGND